MKVCQNYHCESKGRKLPAAAFRRQATNKDGRENTCARCRDKASTNLNTPRGTLRTRLEKQGIKLTAAGSRT